MGDLTWYEGERWPKVSADGDEGSGYWSSGVVEPRTRSKDEVAALEPRSKDETDEGDMGRGLSTRGATKMGLVGTGVAARDATEATLARMSRGVRGRGR